MAKGRVTGSAEDSEEETLAERTVAADENGVSIVLDESVLAGEIDVVSLKIADEALDVWLVSKEDVGRGGIELAGLETLSVVVLLEGLIVTNVIEGNENDVVEVAEG